MQTLITVTAKRDGFRRAGRAWSTAPTTVPADAFDTDQLAALHREPMLVVEERQAEAPEGDAEPVKAEAPEGNTKSAKKAGK
uniref:Mu-like prophage FluMu N-terminal domain-containing protein n=1 Tax=Mizugakiibacter sediminis TaxID=1475481 RepID=A0A0S6YZI7_9GAMM